MIVMLTKMMIIMRMMSTTILFLVMIIQYSPISITWCTKKPITTRTITKTQVVRMKFRKIDR